jgi:hypothetical protein
VRSSVSTGPMYSLTPRFSISVFIDSHSVTDAL